MKALRLSLALLLAWSPTGWALFKKGAAKPSLKERRALAKAEAQKYQELRHQGVDEVSHTKEAALMRKYRLRKKKRKGLFLKRPADLTSILFPGVAPENFQPKEPIWAITDSVQSKKTQLPFRFYELPGCPKPEAGTAWKKNLKQRRNLGVRLQGNQLLPAPYSFKTIEDQFCTPLCQVKVAPKKTKWLKSLINRQYRVQMSLDTLPLLMRDKSMNFAVRGYPVGFKRSSDKPGAKSGEYYVYNHLKFIITYQMDRSSFDGVRITGFDVQPTSIQHDLVDGGESKVTAKTVVSSCHGTQSVANDPKRFLQLPADGEGMEIMYSYEVEWQQSDLAWADRWDVYMINVPDDGIHYYAIMNSLMVVLFLTGAIATILVRTLNRDIAGYNEQTLEDAKEESGWKLLHGDVFRPPTTYPMALSVVTGTGAQIGTACLLTLICAMVKWLNPMKKGATLTAILILYVLSGFVSGYVSSRMYKFCKGKDWKLNTIATAAALPGSLVSIFIILNIFLSFAGAATAVSFCTILALFGMWMCISTPLVFVGARYGFKEEPFSVPTKTTQIPRVVPESPCHTRPPWSLLLGGLLPFGSVCLEVFFIMNALWLHQIYYMMGFLFIVLLILTATCAEVSIVMTYLQLVEEDHRWWWKSFGNCASAGFFLFLYSLCFLASRLELVGFLPVVVYVTYMWMISVCFGLFCGSVGVLSSFWFNTKIYGAIKVD
ncbi:Transmembrane 9 superfamily [Seminavis robusta]|uniref:Transmembrane 9 superfamily member n=1 Tax=Seminavis robusta TaxID=568900 RepID=A0A9N8DW92_9STRA|nr:Transmembrane 9 superfamily [Seminavis robusta]|eukprot:Sro327_g118400.1 Transmembrane 9 superfamily (715) ;mRNA; r:45896-48135